jgi:hypothetical protein
VGYWENNPEIPQRNNILNNIFYNVDKLVKGKSAFLVFKENLQTTTNPGFIDKNNPLKGFNGVNTKKNAPFFKGIPTSKIGCNLPKIE